LVIGHGSSTPEPRQRCCVDAGRPAIVSASAHRPATVGELISYCHVSRIRRTWLIRTDAGRRRLDASEIHHVPFQAVRQGVLRRLVAWRIVMAPPQSARVPRVPATDVGRLHLTSEASTQQVIFTVPIEDCDFCRSGPPSWR